MRDLHSPGHPPDELARLHGVDAVSAPDEGEPRHGVAQALTGFAHLRLVYGRLACVSIDFFHRVFSRRDSSAHFPRPSTGIDSGKSREVLP